MTSRYELRPVTPDEATRWDELITSYESGQLFPSQDMTRPSCREPRHGYEFFSHPGRHTDSWVLLRRHPAEGPFRILGSPLKGWCTNFLGPLANRNLNQEAFLEALDGFAEHERLAMVEIDNPLLVADFMEKAGYKPVYQPTCIVRFTPGDIETMWNRIDRKSRQEIRKAKRAGLVVEDTDDASISDEFLSQFVKALARKNLFPPYDRNCPRLLFEYLKPRGMLFALRVSEPLGRIIATGLFPHDHRTVYFWGGASRIDSWKYSPNDLLQWTVMEIAAQRGLTIYNWLWAFQEQVRGALQSPKR